MDRQTFIENVSQRLNALGVAYTIGAGADIVINASFLTAGWSTGNKQISYEASTYLNETEKTVFMWELTKESGSGFSFGGSSETSFQTGKTLFRKVKSVQYGPDGKAYEIDLDLGAIPNAVKEAAKACGWKYKTVLNRNKAIYPAGMPVMTGQQPATPQYAPPSVQQPFAPQPPFQQPFVQQPPLQQPVNMPYNQAPAYPYANQPAPKKKMSGMSIFIFILLVAITAVLFIFGGASLLGLGIAAVILLIVFIILKALAGKGFIRNLILFIIALVVLFIAFAFATGNGHFNFSVTLDNGKPSIDKVGFAKSIDPNTMAPVDKVNGVFSQNDTTIYYVIKIYNTLAGTNLHVVWSYENGKSTIENDMPINQDLKGNYYSISIQAGPGAAFPIGKYSVTITGTKDNKELYTLTDNFSITK